MADIKRRTFLAAFAASLPLANGLYFNGWMLDFFMGAPTIYPMTHYAALHYGGPEAKYSEAERNGLEIDAEKVLIELDLPNSPEHEFLRRMNTYFLIKRLNEAQERMDEDGLSINIRSTGLRKLKHPGDGAKLRAFDHTLRKMEEEGREYDPAWGREILYLASPAAQAFAPANDAVWADSNGTMTIQVRWAWRSAEMQAVMDARTAEGMLAGKPGSSWHQLGFAIDVQNHNSPVKGGKQVKDYLYSAGFANSEEGLDYMDGEDAWHYVYVGYDPRKGKPKKTSARSSSSGTKWSRRSVLRPNRMAA